LNPKKKNRKKQLKSNQIEVLPSSVYVPVFTPDFKTDLAWWYNQDTKKGDKILDLVADILDGDPFSGLGKPEPLKYIAADSWSRRIDQEHRLIYRVTAHKIYFLQARYHYQID
jgi:toxin YoeB